MQKEEYLVDSVFVGQCTKLPHTITGSLFIFRLFTALLCMQGMADIPNALETVKELKKHKDFLISNPNRARSLISSFAANMGHFHARDGKGYEFIGDCVLELDALNPQVK